MISADRRTGILTRIYVVIILAITSIGSQALADELFRFAGDGTIGFGGDSGPAEDAQLNMPMSVVVDSVGNTYIADFENHRIRRVAVNGMISTVSGTGAAGFSGDGGLAELAALNHPIHVAVDSQDNLYFIDFDNRRVRKITVATGIISTVAGQGGNGFNGDGIPATGANLNIPWGIDIDAAGNIFIADRGNHRIRRVDVATGMISTVAGDSTQALSTVDPTEAYGDGGPATAAQLNSPHGIAVDGAGNLYIADTFNHRIRKVDAATGIITTIAGEIGFIGFKDGLAAEARFRQPRGLSLSAAGDLYIAGARNNRIRKLDTLGMVSTIAGTGVGDFNGDGQAPEVSELYEPNDMFFASNGDLYIADTFNARVRVISADSPNAPPTDISLSNDSIGSSGGVDALVGTLSTADPDGADVHVYSLIAGTGDTDNGLFTITGDQLTANDATSMGGVYSIRVITDDQVDASFVEALVVNVVDDVAPSITLIGDNPQTIVMGGAYTELGATAADNVDGDVTASIEIDASAVDVNTEGDYIVTYDVSDAEGNAATTVTRTVTVEADSTPPVITLLGANPQTITRGQAYVELGATAQDDVDGDISVDIVIDSSAVNTGTAGNYTVTYNVSDAAGNAATTVTRTVSVQAPPPPPPPPSGGGGSMGILGLLALAGLALRRRVRWIAS